MATYSLPDLAYDYGALAPHISGQIMELHHGKHHAAYVAGANATLEGLEEARGSGAFGSINMLEKNLAFHVSGHILHSVFWKNLSPDGGGRPDGELAQAIERELGGFEAFQAQLTNATNLVQGSGWGVLALEPVSKRLIVEQVYDHQGNVAQASVPLLVIDSWEHAYYLQYQNRKPEFVQAVWKLVNWEDVAARYAAAKTSTLPGI